MATTKGIEFSEHPEYDANKADWQKWKDLYEGRHAVLTQDRYLWRHMLEYHPTEGAKLRQLREQRSRYLNLLEPVLSVWASLFFKEDPQFDDSVRELFGEAFEDVDGRGNSFAAFLKGPVLTSYLRDGKAIVYTDAPVIDKPVVTKADEARHRAFFELLPALAVKDWQESPDAACRFELLRYEYTAVKPRQDLTEKPAEQLYTKVLKLQPGEAGGFTIRVFALEKSQGGKDAWSRVGDERVVPVWGELPVAAVFGESWVKDVAEQQLSVFNYMSCHANQLVNQGFQRVVFAGNLDTETKRAWSEFAALVVPENTQVITIGAADTGPMERAVEKAIEHLFKVAFNRTQSLASSSNEAPGADTLREMKDDLVALIKSSIAD